MGSHNSVQININLDRAYPLFFAGETVEGTVNVKIQEGHIKVDEIFILLEGETGYTVTYSVTDGNGSTRIQTDYHTNLFFKEKQVFEGPESRRKELIYYPGQYSWRFQISLPDQLPPTINQTNKYPHVRYYLKFVIDKSWYKRNTNETLYLTVFPHVNLLYNPQNLTSSVFGNHNRKDINLKGTINKLGYIPGEIIHGTIEIENPRRVLLKQIHLSLIQRYRIESNSEKEKIVEKILPTIVNTKHEQIVENFSLSIPHQPLPPSYKFHAGFLHKVKVDIDYVVQFDVKVEGMFTNFEITIPITLGTECEKNSNHYQSYEASNILPNSISYYPEITMEKEYSPPNYYSVTK